MAKKRTAKTGIELASLSIGLSFEAWDKAISNLRMTTSSLGNNLQRTVSQSFAVGARSGEKSIGHLSRAFSASTRDMSRSVERVSRDMSRSMTAAFNAAGKAATAFGRVGTQAVRNVHRGSAGRGVGFGVGAGIGLAAANKIQSAIGSVPGMLGQAIVDSTELKALEKRLERTFDNIVGDARDFSKKYSSAIGGSESQTKDTLQRFSEQLRQTSLVPEKRLGAAKTLTKVANDLASAWGTSVPDAANAMLSAMRGEADPIERYAITANEAAVSAELFASGLAKSSSKATEAQKVLARTNLLISQSASVHGVATKQTDLFGRETNKLSTAMQTFSQKIGSALEPAAAHLARFATESIGKFEQSIGPMDELGEKLKGVAAEWTSALEPMREKLVSFAKTVPESMDSIGKSLAGFSTDVVDLTGSLKDLSGMLGSLNGKGTLGSLDMSRPIEWLRGRARGDDLKGLMFGADAVNQGNAAMRDLASTTVSTPEQRAASVAKARVPVLKKLVHGVEDLLSGATRMLYGTSGQPVRSQPDKATTVNAGQPVLTSTTASLVPKPAAQQAVNSWTSFFNSIGVGQRDQSKEGYDRVKATRSGGAYGTTVRGLTRGIDRIASAMASYARIGGAITEPSITGPSKWSQMSDADKRKALLEQDKKSGGSMGTYYSKLWGSRLDDEAKWLRDKNPSVTNPIHELMRPSLKGKAKDRSSLSEWATIGGTIFENMVGATGQTKHRGAVQFMGITDLQKHVQQSIGQDEAQRDKLKLDVLKNIKAEAEKEVAAIGRVGTQVATALSGMLGLQ